MSAEHINSPESSLEGLNPSTLASESADGVRPPHTGLEEAADSARHSPPTVLPSEQDCDTVPKEVSHVGEAEEGAGERDGGSAGAEGRVGEVQGVQSGDDAERAGEVGSEAVRGEQPEGVDLEASIAEQLAALAAIPAVESPTAVVGRAPHTFYGAPTNPRHAVPHTVVKAVVKARYENAEVQDLFERLRAVFKEMGHEF